MTPEEIQNDLLLCEETRNVGEDFTAKMIIAARCMVFVRDKAHRYIAEVQRLTLQATLFWGGVNESLEASQSRREWLASNIPRCPICGEKQQIQLFAYLQSKARWRCRLCRHQWIFEPENRIPNDAPKEANAEQPQ